MVKFPEHKPHSVGIRDVLLFGLALMVILQSLRASNGLLHSTISSSSSTSQIAPAITNNYYGSSARSDRSLAKTRHKTSVHLCDPQDMSELSSRNLLMSQKNEDRELLGWFNGLCGGTYIEAGGLDGWTGSNTYVFNQALGWKGLLVELSPTMFKDLENNRPNEIARINSAICQTSETLHFFDAGKILNDPAVNGVWEFAPEDHRRTWWKTPEHTIDDCDPVQCEPLQKLIDYALPLYMMGEKTVTLGGKAMKAAEQEIRGVQSNDSYYFDIFSLDVEGAEYEVLRTLDFDRVGFGMLVIENEGQNFRKMSSVRTLLEANGYVFLHKHECNEWYMNGDFHEIYGDFIMKA